MNLINRLLKDEQGAAAIEYGIIVAVIAVALITVLAGVSTKLKEKFTDIGGALDSVVSGKKQSSQGTTATAPGSKIETKDISSNNSPLNVPTPGLVG